MDIVSQKFGRKLILKDDENSSKIVNFIKENNIKVLNVCGHREFEIEKKKFSSIVEEILIKALEKEVS